MAYTLQEAKAKVQEALDASPEQDNLSEILKAIILAIEELQS